MANNSAATGLSQTTGEETLGFIGLGVMGQAMALNLANAGYQLVVWNRSVEATLPLEAVGSHRANTVDEVFQRASTVFVMLLNAEVIDSVLGRGTPAFAARVAGRTVVSMSSVAPDYSKGLAADIAAACGHYIEAPVSGSRQPAREGQLVSMVAGDQVHVERVLPLLGPMCREAVYCGEIGNALLMKLAVNLYLNTTLAGLSEAVHFAGSVGLELTAFKSVIDAGPMASGITRVKLPKLIDREFSVQAATSDALASCTLIASAARKAGVASPMLDLAKDLYAESVALGNSRMDMASVLAAIEDRSTKTAAYS